MAIFHFSAKVISRSSGRSSVASAAYRAGTKMTCAYDGLTHDYGRKKGVIFTEVLLPENAPDSFHDRDILWNSVEMAERNKKAQTARDIEIALPVELTRAQNINLVREYVRSNFTSKGMCADICYHDKNDGNPHVHIMLTMRPLNADGTWGAKSKKVYDLDANGNKIYDKSLKTYQCSTVKATDWDNKDNVAMWRNNWAEICNKRFIELNLQQRIDHRSFKEQGVSRIPTVHLGAYASALVKQNKPSELHEKNENIKKINRELIEIETAISNENSQIINFSSFKERMVSLKTHIDEGIEHCNSFNDFLSFMQNKGYGIKQGKHIAFCPPNQSTEHIRFIRAKSLGELYTEENIYLRINKKLDIADDIIPKDVIKIISEHSPNDVKLLIDIKDNIKYKNSRAYSNWVDKDNLKRSVATLNYLAHHGIGNYERIDVALYEKRNLYAETQKDIKNSENLLLRLNNQKRHTQAYLDTKSIYDNYSSLANKKAKEKFYKEHESEIRIHESAKTELQQYKVNGKLKGIDALKESVDSLKSRIDLNYNELSRTKSEIGELTKVKNNVDNILEVNQSKVLNNKIEIS